MALGVPRSWRSVNAPIKIIAKLTTPKSAGLSSRARIRFDRKLTPRATTNAARTQDAPPKARRRTDARSAGGPPTGVDPAELRVTINQLSATVRHRIVQARIPEVSRVRGT